MISPMTRSTTSAQSLYVQLADELRQNILAKRWLPGELLPSEHDLCREHGVSRGTVTRAIEILLREGLAHRRQGAGTYVSRPSMNRRPGILASFSESVHQQGRVPSQKVLEVQSLSRAQALQYGCNTAAIKLSRLRLVDDVPWAIHRSIIPSTVVAKVPALQPQGAEILAAPGFSLYQAMDEAGIVVDHAEEILRARTATAAEAELLGIAENDALMAIHRKGFDAAGRLLEMMEADYVGESYSYEVKLARARLSEVTPFDSKAGPRFGRRRNE
jgi:GntR family transcriptional regulator